MITLFTHHVTKLDGGEPGLDYGPQAPKEVGRQGEPAAETNHSVTGVEICYSSPVFMFGLITVYV